MIGAAQARRGILNPFEPLKSCRLIFTRAFFNSASSS